MTREENNFILFSFFMKFLISDLRTSLYSASYFRLVISLKADWDVTVR